MDETEKFLARVEVQPGDDPCHIWRGVVGTRGYGETWFRGRPSTRAHRVAYVLFVGPIPDGLMVLHSCDIPLCVNPAHLRFGTHADNMEDRRVRNRHWVRRGAEHGMAVLTEDAVRSIREWYAAGDWTQKMLGQAFGVSRANVGLIVTRRAWEHVS